jgi:ABC-type transport system involved in multi-copper enzyme maturation permease subunit
MIALLLRDFFGFLRLKRFFVMRTAAVGVPLFFFVVAGDRLGSESPDVVGRAIFGTTTVVVLIAILAGAPALAGPALALERKAARLDVLLSAPVSVRKVVAAKFLSRAGQLALIVLAALPWIPVAVLFGGVSISQAGEALAVLAATLAGTCGLSLLGGAGTTDPATAIRRACAWAIGPVAAAALAAATFPASRGGPWSWIGALGEGLSPFSVLAAVQAPQRIPTASVAFMNPTGFYCTVAVLAGLLGVLLAIITLRHHQEGGRRPPATRPAQHWALISRWRRRKWSQEVYSRLPVLLRHRPIVWLEVLRGARHFHRARLVAFLVLAGIVEGFFIHRLASANGTPPPAPGMTPAGTMAMTASEQLGLHLTAISIFLVLALLAALGAGAAAFHRDQDERLLDVLHSTPRPTSELIAAKLAGSLAAALPWWLLSMTHAVIGLFTGDLWIIGAALYGCTSAVFLRAAGTVALFGSLRAPNAMRAMASATARFIAYAILPPLFLAPAIGLFVQDLLGAAATVLVVILWPPLIPLLAAAAPPMFWVAVAITLLVARMTSHALTRWLPKLYDHRRDNRPGLLPGPALGVDKEIAMWRQEIRDMRRPRKRRARRSNDAPHRRRLWIFR